MLDRGRTRPEQEGTALSDRPHFLKPLLGAADPKLPFEAFAQCASDRTDHGVAGQAREGSC